MARQKVRGPIPLGHVVEDFYQGHVHIRICDDYCRDKTPEEVQAILDRIAEIAMNARLAQAYQESLAAEEKEKMLCENSC